MKDKKHNNQIIKIILTSLIAALACAGIIHAATTIGTNISTTGTLDVTGASTLTGNTAITGTLGVTGLTTLSNASTTLTSISGIGYVGGANGLVLADGSITDASGSIDFGNEQLTTTGNIGIGTSSPYAKLSVAGEAVAEYFTATSTTATSSFLGIFSIGSTTPSSVSMFSVGTSSPLFYVDKNSGYVGIGTANPSSELEVNGTIKSTGSDERITGSDTSIGIDFNDVTNAVYIFPRISGTTQYLGFRSMAAELISITSLHTALGWITPATDEVDVVGGNTFTYKNIAASEITAVGDVWEINGTGHDEYLCTGASGTCVDSANYTFVDGSGDGFAIWAYVEVLDTPAAQVVASKWDGTTTAREWSFVITNAEKLIVSLYDESADVACTQTADASMSAGNHMVGFLYDGTGGADANDGITLIVDGVAVALAANTTCTGYVTMVNTAAPVYIGSYGNVSSIFYGDMAPVFFKELPSGTTISATQWLQLYQVGKVHLAW